MWHKIGYHEMYSFFLFLTFLFKQTIFVFLYFSHITFVFLIIASVYLYFYFFLNFYLIILIVQFLSNNNLTTNTEKMLM